MFTLRIYHRTRGFIIQFKGNSIASCEKLAKEAGYEEREPYMWLR